VSASSRSLLLEAEQISKRYGAVQALKPVDFSVTDGAVHGILGKNGAGKSTLVGIVAGAVAPSTGRLAFGGADVTHLSLAERRARGIRLLSQHSEIVASLTVMENLLMPDYPRRGGLIDWGAARREAEEELARYGLDLPLDRPAGLLATPDQRKLNIVKTLSGDARLAILDEPTTALTRSERESLFGWIRELNEAGQTFMFISHFNNEIRAICDEYTVLRDGEVVSRGTSARQVSASRLSQLVTGADVHEFQRGTHHGDAPLLELDEFVAEGAEPLSLTVARGEIVGFVGLPASGANEVARALAGLHPIHGGTVRLDGKPLRIRSVRQATDEGIAYLTNDRITEGLVPELTVRESLRLGRWPTSRGGLIDQGSMQRTFLRVREQLSMRVSGPAQKVSELSGGNQQKVLLGRLLAAEPKLLILDEPTLGIDVGVKEEVHRIIDELTDAGIGVIVLAYDTDELVRLVDRAVVFRDGRAIGTLAGEELTIDAVLGYLDHAGRVTA
jgi:ABC-type sugar transport system ATPase subunit